MRSALDSFFKPSTCAVVGASKDPAKPGHQVVAAMLRAGYKGEIYPVNPGEKEILGLECYPRLSSIPGEVELVVMCAPVRILDSFIEDIKERALTRGDLSAIVCSTAGFAEEGTPESIGRQEGLVKACKEAGIRLMGPNCLGVIDTYHGVDTTFILSEEYRKGGISFISQSGALGAWLVQAWSTHPVPVGINKFISLGNTADVQVTEILQYLACDESTKVIGMYVEGAEDARSLVEAAGMAARVKPVLVLKTGRTPQGTEAARSHTGALAGRDKVWDAAFRQYGVLRVDTVDEILDSLRAFDGLPEPASNRVFLLTHAGGPGVYALDFFNSWEGVTMARVSRSTKEALREGLPPYAAICRPDGHADLTASVTSRQFAHALNLTLSDEGVGGTVMLLMPTAYMKAEEVISDILEEVETPLKKPFFPTLMCGKYVREARRLLEEEGIPTFSNPLRAGRAFLNMVRRSSTRQNASRERPRVRPVPKRALDVMEGALAEGRRALSEVESAIILESYGIPVSGWGLAGDPCDAVRIAERLGYPVAIKAVSPDIPHKTDAGCLRLDIHTEDALRLAYHEVVEAARSFSEARLHGVLVQSMARGIAEVILGGLKEANFGPVVMTGAGGIMAEVWKDVSFRLAPVLPEEAGEMLEEVESTALLKGIRGLPPGDMDALTRAIEDVSHLVACPNILEVDVNPLIVLEQGKGVLAVDALITLA